MKIKPSEQFTGLTLEQWHQETDNITWAQQEPRFKMMLSVILNEVDTAHKTCAGCSEGRAFGRVEGYHMAIEVFRSLARKPTKPPPEPEAFAGEPLPEKQNQESFD